MLVTREGSALFVEFLLEVERLLGYITLDLLRVGAVDQVDRVNRVRAEVQYLFRMWSREHTIGRLAACREAMGTLRRLLNGLPFGEGRGYR